MHVDPNLSFYHTSIKSYERGLLIFGEQSLELRLPNGWEVFAGPAARGYTHDDEPDTVYLEVVVRNKRLGIARKFTDKYSNEAGYIDVPEFIRILTALNGDDASSAAFVNTYAPKKEF